MLGQVELPYTLTHYKANLLFHTARYHCVCWLPHIASSSSFSFPSFLSGDKRHYFLPICIVSELTAAASLIFGWLSVFMDDDGQKKMASPELKKKKKKVRFCQEFFGERRFLSPSLKILDLGTRRCKTTGWWEKETRGPSKKLWSFPRMGEE